MADKVHCCVCGAEISDSAFEDDVRFYEIRKTKKVIPQRCCSAKCWDKHAEIKTGLRGPVADPSVSPVPPGP